MGGGGVVALILGRGRHILSRFFLIVGYVHCLLGSLCTGSNILLRDSANAAPETNSQRMADFLQGGSGSEGGRFQSRSLWFNTCRKWNPSLPEYAAPTASSLMALPGNLPPQAVTFWNASNPCVLTAISSTMASYFLGVGAPNWTLKRAPNLGEEWSSSEEGDLYSDGLKKKISILTGEKILPRFQITQILNQTANRGEGGKDIYLLSPPVSP